MEPPGDSTMQEHDNKTTIASNLSKEERKVYTVNLKREIWKEAVVFCLKLSIPATEWIIGDIIQIHASPSSPPSPTTHIVDG